MEMSVNFPFYDITQNNLGQNQLLNQNGKQASLGDVVWKWLTVSKSMCLVTRLFLCDVTKLLQATEDKVTRLSKGKYRHTVKFKSQVISPLAELLAVHWLLGEEETLFSGVYVATGKVLVLLQAILIKLTGLYTKS